MTDRPEVVYALPDTLGGVASVVHNLLEHRAPDPFRYATVLTRNVTSNDTPTRDPFLADRVERVPYSSPPENLHAILRRVARAIGSGPGVLVSNDWIELAAASVADSGRTVVAIAHGDMEWYYQLAERHSSVVDVFVAISQRIYDRLIALLPDRADSILLQPFGVDIPAAARTPASGALRVAHVGRLKEDKGIFDLPLIDRALLDRGVDVRWTIQGDGPHGAELRARWSARTNVNWTGYQPKSRVLDVFHANDVLVMPSRQEGLPVSLLEAGAAGTVPVISDLPSGIPDVVTPGVTGFRPEIGDVGGFADAIARLDADRALLASMSTAVRARVSMRFEARTNTAAYQRIFSEYRERKRPRPAHVPLAYGSRLDQPWMPNTLVRMMRSVLARA